MLLNNKMAKKTRTRQITITDDKGAFTAFFKKLTGEKADYDFEGIASLRSLLSNEKARMLNVIKTKEPGSIYELAKVLGRDFKAVNDDVKLLERFGFIDFIKEKTGKRERLKPVIIVDSINIEIVI